MNTPLLPLHYIFLHKNCRSFLKDKKMNKSRHALNYLIFNAHHSEHKHKGYSHNYIGNELSEDYHKKVLFTLSWNCSASFHGLKNIHSPYTWYLAMTLSVTIASHIPAKISFKIYLHYDLICYLGCSCSSMSLSLSTQRIFSSTFVYYLSAVGLTWQMILTQIFFLNVLLLLK